MVVFTELHTPPPLAKYDIVFTSVGEETTPAAGDAAGENPRECRAEYRHIAGIKQEVVDVAHMPAIFAEFIDVPAGARHYTIARTIWSSFLWGAVNAKLTEARIDGRPIDTRE